MKGGKIVGVKKSGVAGLENRRETCGMFRDYPTSFPGERGWRLSSSCSENILQINIEKIFTIVSISKRHVF